MVRGEGEIVRAPWKRGDASNPLVAGSNPAGRIDLTDRSLLFAPPRPHFNTDPVGRTFEQPQARSNRPVTDHSSRPATRAGAGTALAWLVIIGLVILHAWGVWIGSGGWEELSSHWPIAYQDHPVHYHSAAIARDLFRSTGTNSGYDPSFMAGYPKSLIFPQSSTIFDLAGLIAGPGHAAVATKLLSFAVTAGLPILLAASAVLAGLRAPSTAWAVLLTVIYAWTDGGGAGFPLNYAYYGMIAYLLAVPLGLLAVVSLGRFLERGGLVGWLAAAWSSSFAWMAHVTIPMVVAPAGLACYLTAILKARRAGTRLGWRRHLGVWLIPAFAAAVNVFWWWPGVLLASLMDNSAIAFYHDNAADPVLKRLGSIFWADAPVSAVLVAGLAPGLVALARRSSIVAAGVLGFAIAGLGWGYLAGGIRAIDVLQPGRHTYALGLGACLAGGVLIGELLARLRPGPGRLDLWAALALLLLGTRLFGPTLQIRLPARLGLDGSRAFLSSRPPARLVWIQDQLIEHLKPGDRIFYEEGGEEATGVPDPFGGGRFSGLLPDLTGVEVIGGPYLRASIATNHAQFGSGKLMGCVDWGLEEFREAAELYRPSAIVCASPKAVKFCRSHPELIEIVATETRELRVLVTKTGQVVRVESELIFGLVNGYGGSTIRGEATVEAAPGRLAVRDARGAEVDGLVVLRYHHVPYLLARPPVRLEAVQIGADPVPFIGFRPPPGSFALELDFPP